MGNILFQNNHRSTNSILNLVSSIRGFGSSESMFASMYRNNPDFRQFADNMRGKTPEQAFRENGLDYNQFKNLRW